MLHRILLSLMFAAAAALATISLVPPRASAAEPIKRIAIYVEPYYRAGQSADEPPQVAVGKRYDALLSSNRREDILAARDLIEADPKFVTPMTLMVLAIRLYDTGFRDDAVFWFYAAKHRYLTLADAAEPDAPLLQRPGQVISDFSALAGPIINGYAFCDLNKQRELRARALAWVEKNPYAAVFDSRLPARMSDRNEALAEAIRSAKARAAKERRHLDDPKNVETLLVSRKKNEADTKFCWN